MTYDIVYIKDSMFTRFIPNTVQGESLWRDLYNQNGLSNAVLNIDAARVIRQIQAAGYSVGKASKPKESINDILKELEGI